MKRSATVPRSTPDGFEPGASVNRQATDDLLARLAPGTYDATARTVEAIFSTGARVRRWGIFEELAVSNEAVDLGRVLQGQVRLLDTHDSSSIDKVLGVVVSARIESGRLVGTIRFAETEQGRRAEAMVQSGDLTGISVGYRVTTWTLTATENDQEVWRADRWELLEVSLVAVPADPGAMVRSEPSNPTLPRAEAHNEENDEMRRNLSPAGPAPVAPTNPAPAPAPDTRAAAPAPSPAPAPSSSPSHDDILRNERARTAEIIELGRTHGVEDAVVRSAIDRGASIDEFRRITLEALAARSERNAITGVSPGHQPEAPEARRAALTEALTLRLQESSGARVTPSDHARSYMGHTLAEMAAVAIGARNMPRTARDRLETFERAFHTTSDFPIILSGALNTRLEASYLAAQPVYRRIARQQNFSDFRPHDVIRPGDFPMLQPVRESGEIKYGTFGEKKETIIVAPYAIAVRFSRQLMVNDQLGAIDQVLANQGTTIALFEEITFFSMKGTVGPVLKEDNKAVFHADHGNLLTASAITVDALGLARAALRKQKRLDGNVMGLAPRILLVSPDKETEAEKITTDVQARVSTDVNPFSGRLETVVAPQLTGNAWELYTDAAMGSNWQWGLLDGYTAPRMRTDEPFGQQGIAFSLEHDFGCGAVDFRFGARNPGA